jgi:hypothetical protein
VDKIVASKTNRQKEPVVVQLPPPGSGKGCLKALGGSSSDDFNNALANQVVSSLWLAHSDAAGRDKLFHAALAAVVGIGPRDELEGMLAAQMVAAHTAVMECYRRAMIPEQPLEGRSENLKYAAKLSRVYAHQLEALARYRGKGQQTVRVEHVTVNAGGQAIVGNVTGGTRAKGNSEEQPDAKHLTHAQVEALPSEVQAERENVPVTGG